MLRSISFENFKCLSGKQFDLNKVNVFTGYNGRGKSSVMQAILMLSQSYRKGDLNSIAHLHVNGDFVNLGDFDDLLTNTDNDNLNFTLKLKLEDTDAKEHEVSLQYDMDNDYSIGVLTECTVDDESYFDTAPSMADEETDKKEKGELKLLPGYLYNQFWSQNIHYVSADRKGPVKFVERSEIPDCFKVGADGSRTINTISAYTDVVSTEMNVSGSDTTQHDLQTAVSMWLNEIMLGGKIAVEGNAVRKKENTESAKRSSILSLGFSINDADRKYPSYHVGFGYSYILSIIVTALIAKENDIVIIENPEAHLHPEAQTRLTFLLAKLGARGVQVFVETHSEHVLNGFRLAALKDEYKLKNSDLRLFFFDYDFHMEPLLIEPNGRIENWPKRFFDQYQNELSEIIKLGAKVPAK